MSPPVSPEDEPGAGETPPAADGARDEPGLPSLPRRALLVFVAPGTLFEALDERPVWLDVIVLVAALSLASTLLIPEELVRAAMMEQAGQGVDSEEVERWADFIHWSGRIAAVVGPLFVAAVVAGVSHLVFTLVLGGRSTYRKLFCAAAHMMLIPTVGTLLTVPLILSTGDVQTTLSLHLLVPGLGPEGFWYRFLHGLNVFGLAGAAVMGVAVGRLYRDRSAGSAAVVMVALYVAMKAAVAVFSGPAAGP